MNHNVINFFLYALGPFLSCEKKSSSIMEATKKGPALSASLMELCCRSNLAGIERIFLSDGCIEMKLKPETTGKAKVALCKRVATKEGKTFTKYCCCKKHLKRGQHALCVWLLRVTVTCIFRRR